MSAQNEISGDEVNAVNMDVDMEVSSKWDKFLTADKSVLPWVEKYRPASLDQLVAHEDIIRMIERMSKKGMLPHMLLHGPPGTGKTSTILALAKTLYKEKFRAMTLELNASDARGIDVVRDQIKTFVSVKQLFITASNADEQQPKLVILDEADNMTQTAQFALRRMIEQYAQNARFILICNYSGKIIPALQSRCTKLRFAPLSPEQIAGRLHHIAAEEKVQLTEDGAKAAVDIGQGDLRKTINVFQTTSMAYEVVDARNIYKSSGVPHPQDIDLFLKTLLSRDVSFAAGLHGLKKLLQEKGYALDDFLRLMHKRLIQTSIPAKQRADLMIELAKIDNRLKQSCSENVQLAAVIGAFHIMKAEVAL